MAIYKRKVTDSRLLHINKTYKAESLMMKIRKMLANKEPIEDEIETVYTNKKDGVLPAYDIRTDRWEVAMEAIGKMQNAEVSEQLKTQNVQPASDDTVTGEKTD